ncbi:MAG: D-alanyl-D-alanine dipeptidase [Chitinophagaceae bacterium]|nr:MAG: D-alanyl-D-alanine dipeptidase [Chitinophagaceae bacterium]
MNCIVSACCRTRWLPILLVHLTFSSLAQAQLQTTPGLKIIATRADFLRSVKANPKNEMLPLKENIPQLQQELIYTTARNFTGKTLYPSITNTYMRKPAVFALQQVQKTLLQQGLGLKIWDAYRPYDATKKMWSIVPDERYAANPKYGSGHNRGVAVDLTLINISTGKELNMGTGFDHFSDTAHVYFTGLPEQVLENRKLLQSVMQANGFKVLDTEWWHFYLPESKQYDVLNLSFKQLKKINQQASH